MIQRRDSRNALVNMVMNFQRISRLSECPSVSQGLCTIELGKWNQSKLFEEG
jgi:hypothetical protein